MLSFSLYQEHAYKYFQINYTSFPLFLALKSIYQKPKSWSLTNKRKLNQEAFYMDCEYIYITHEYI